MKKIPVELRQLEYFQMAARLKNLTRAAERLHVSQPNITVAIKKLESSLGIQLFERSQKQLSLTPEGSVFLSRVDVALRNVQDALIEIDDYKQLQKGTIRIGIPPMIGSFLFPRIYCDFRRQHPNLAINLFEEGSKKAREKLEEDEIDFGIVIISDPSPKLSVLSMATCQLVVGVPVDHPLAKKSSITLEDFADAESIFMKEGSFLRSQILEKCQSQGLEPNIIIESNQIETIKGLVSSGAGITCLLDFVLENTPGIKVIPFKEPLFYDLGLAWKKERYVSHAAQAFIDFCRDQHIR